MYIIKLIIILFCIFLLADTNAVACTDNDNRHAIELEVMSKNDEAFEFISAKLKECPDYIEFRIARSMIFNAKKMYREELEEVEHILRIGPLNDFFLLERCILSESLDAGKNKDSHLLCFKNVSEIMKSKNDGEPLIETKNYLYVLAVSMAELPEAEEIRRQHIQFLDTLDKKEPLFMVGQRDIFLHFDRKKFIYRLQQ